MSETNDRLRAARERVESPYATGQPLSRGELADLVNERVHAGSGRVIELSANYVGKLERGQIRWPQAAYRGGCGLCWVWARMPNSGFAGPGAVAPP